MTNKQREQSTLLTNAEVILEMSNQRIPSVDPITASGSNKKNFDRLRSALGFILNMALTMAQSPEVLDGYMSLSSALTKGHLGSFRHRSGTVDIAKMDLC